MMLSKSIKERNILVVGDIMLDAYYYGDVKRISPEAPVPVFLQKNISYRLGGAANVAANLAKNGQKITVLSIIGKDDNGKRLIKLLNDAGVSSNLIEEDNRPTCVKTRLLAGNNQQVLRLDYEDSRPIDNELELSLINELKVEIDSFDLIIISDYMKGLLTESFTKAVIDTANSKSIMVFVDVKDSNFHKYDNAYLIKPNRKELGMLTELPVSSDDDVLKASLELCKQSKSQYVLTTLGPKGMILVDKHGNSHSLPTMAHEVFDVTGAGDTVIAYVAMCFANGISMLDSVKIANYAAGIQVSKVGTSSVYLSEVDKEMENTNRAQVNAYKMLTVDDLSLLRKNNSNKKIVFTNGCFDILHIGHIRYLKEAASYGDILVVGVNSDASVKRLKGSDRPVNSEDERLELLSALEFVDYVVLFGEDTPYNIINLCQPDILVKGGDYTQEQVVGKDIVEARGGEVKIVPFVAGKSTTSIIDKIEKNKR